MSCVNRNSHPDFLKNVPIGTYYMQKHNCPDGAGPIFDNSVNSP